MTNTETLKNHDTVNVFVAAGSKDPNDSEMIYEAKKLGEFLGKSGYTFIQGGSSKGLMGAVYNEFIKHSNDVVLHFWDVFDDKIDDFVGRKQTHASLNVRLENFLMDSDVLIVLPGANGTLHEFCTFFEYVRIYRSKYKIILVNQKGFYDGLLMQIKRQEDEGFYGEKIFNKCVLVASDMDEAISLIPANTNKK